MDKQAAVVLYETQNRQLNTNAILIFCERFMDGAVVTYQQYMELARRMTAEDRATHYWCHVEDGVVDLVGAFAQDLRAKKI